MIDLTPLDVRNKRGDFKKGMRGYDPQEVDVFLELVAERLEALVRENIQLRDRTRSLQEQVDAQVGREKAVQDALVTAQELREDMREQSQREADHLMREAESEAKRMIAEAEAEVRSRLQGVERQMDRARASLEEFERRRHRFLQDFRALLERELDNVEVEEGRAPLEERAIDLDLGSRRGATTEVATSGGEAVSSGDTSVPPTSEESTSSAEAGDEGSPAAGSPRGAESAGGSPEAESSPGTGSPTEAGSAPEITSSSEDAVASGSGPSGAGSPGAASGPESSASGPSASPGASTVDVADLGPGAAEPRVDDPPSSLELELMAGAVGRGDESSHPDVPDLETVLAEAGMDGADSDGAAEPPQAEEISPPPADHDVEDRKPEDRLALFDKDDKKKRR